jgi:hypothetical protein
VAKLNTPTPPAKANQATTPRAAPTPVLPDVAGGSKHNPTAPRAKGGPAFYFAWHPEQWMVSNGCKVVPRLRKLRAVPGANGVDRRGGKPAMEEGFKQFDQEGWRIISPEVNGGYLQLTPSGGYLSRWERMIPGSDRTVPDEAGYDGWCLELIEQGVIAEPMDYVLGMLEESIESQINRWREKGSVGASAKAEKVAPRLEAVRKYRAELLAKAGSVPPVPAVPDVA